MRRCRFVLNACIPVAATPSGKSVVGERHPAYLGVYEGAMGPDFTRKRVEGADLVLMLGATINDVDTGVFTAKLDPQRMIHASQHQVIIGHHRYSNVYLDDFLKALCDVIRPHSCRWPQRSPLEHGSPAEAGKQLTIARLVASLNAALTPDMSVISDVGDRLFAARDALNTAGRPSLVSVNLNISDASPAMRRLTQHLGQRVKG